MFSQYQFGFYKNHSTTLALIEMIGRINIILIKVKWWLGHEAFGSVNHSILYKNLNGTELEECRWIYFIISKICKQFVSCKNTSSYTTNSISHVPQVSVLVQSFRVYALMIFSYKIIPQHYSSIDMILVEYSKKKKRLITKSETMACSPVINLL